jgi:hypothetical protein
MAASTSWLAAPGGLDHDAAAVGGQDDVVAGAQLASPTMPSASACMVPVITLSFSSALAPWLATSAPSLVATVAHFSPGQFWARRLSAFWAAAASAGLLSMPCPQSFTGSFRAAPRAS